MEKFNISFSGEILPGHDPAVVKQRLAKALKTDDPAKIAALFSGKPVILRRGMDREAAAGLFVSLRRLGVVTHIVKAPRSSGEADTPTPAAAAAEAVPASPPPLRRKRQPGAPNMFELRLSERAGVEQPRLERNHYTTRAPIVAAAIMLLAFILVGLRFWAESRVQPESGLGWLAVDTRQQPVIEVNGQLLFHDRAGLPTDSLALADFGIAANAPFEFFANGDLLALHREPPSAAPEPLQSLLGVETSTGASLLRCRIADRQCEAFLGGLGPATFVVERRTDTVYLADARADRLGKYSGSGELLAERAMELTAPLYLKFEEGILYLTQAGSDAVTVLKPDDQDFGKQLDRINLAVEDASQSGHIFPGDIAWLNQAWWTIMQSRDGSTAGVYRFSPRWKFEGAVDLPAGALPVLLTRWSAKMLVTDRAAESIYRFDGAARPEKPFSSPSLETALDERQSSTSLSRSLQVAVLLILFSAAVVLMGLGLVQTLRRKVYSHPADVGEPGFDINDANIEWLDPDPNAGKHLRTLGYALAGGAVLALLVVFLARFDIWAIIGTSFILSGIGAFYLALHKSADCHLGMLGDKLIVVDHTNTYRVGSGPHIQYLDNYVMIDDVIVYLGNRLVKHFALGPLQQRFKPVVSRGIKVDHATLQVKMLQCRHPMLFGFYGLVLAAVSLALLLLTA